MMFMIVNSCETQSTEYTRTSDARRSPSVCLSLSLFRPSRIIVPARRILAAALDVVGEVIAPMDPEFIQ